MARLIEYVQTNKPIRVERDGNGTPTGRLVGVRILGAVSANGRTYKPSAISKGAPMCEGKPVFVDHGMRAGDTRPASSKIGWLSNCRATKDGIWGDLNYLRAHPMAGALEESAERNSKLFGLSWEAEGDEVKDRDGKRVVEDISAVHACALTGSPATVAGLFEATDAQALAVQRSADADDVADVDDADASDAENRAAFMTALTPALDDAPDWRAVAQILAAASVARTFADATAALTATAPVAEARRTWVGRDDTPRGAHVVYCETARTPEQIRESNANELKRSNRDLVETSRANTAFFRGDESRMSRDEARRRVKASWVSK